MDDISNKILQKDEPVLDDFVQNEAAFNDLNYVILYFDYIQKSDRRKNGDWQVEEGSKAFISHLIRAKRYHGNTKLMRCADISHDLSFNRLIRVNESIFFHKAMLFIDVDGQIYRLKESDGFLQLHIPLATSIITDYKAQKPKYNYQF